MRSNCFGEPGSHPIEQGVVEERDRVGQRRAVVSGDQRGVPTRYVLPARWYHFALRRVAWASSPGHETMSGAAWGAAFRHGLATWPGGCERGVARGSAGQIRCRWGVARADLTNLAVNRWCGQDLESRICQRRLFCLIRTLGLGGIIFGENRAFGAGLVFGKQVAKQIFYESSAAICCSSRVVARPVRGVPEASWPRRTSFSLS